MKKYLMLLYLYLYLYLICVELKKKFFKKKCHRFERKFGKRKSGKRKIGKRRKRKIGKSEIGKSKVEKFIKNKLLDIIPYHDIHDIGLIKYYWMEQMDFELSQCLSFFRYGLSEKSLKSWLNNKKNMFDSIMEYAIAAKRRKLIYEKLYGSYIGPLWLTPLYYTYEELYRPLLDLEWYDSYRSSLRSPLL